eukprot:TRINITY_DN122424_c0_g1_i1.p1 TRINITY_DN122424_c0_g1~~TRINITY_DN122424_c0_g1_i1.p1  ORF type:complete len:381 (-),score=46.14 TRINITY_DN122424_c0_g1_i1:61-1203(-)
MLQWPAWPAGREPLPVAFPTEQIRRRRLPHCPSDNGNADRTSPGVQAGSARMRRRERGDGDASSSTIAARLQGWAREGGKFAQLKAVVFNAIQTDVMDAHRLLNRLGVGGQQTQMCAICCTDFEDGETVSTLPGCQHAFHSDCVSLWLAQASTCPVCRADLVEASVLSEKRARQLLALSGERSELSPSSTSAISEPLRPGGPVAVLKAIWAMAGDFGSDSYLRCMIILTDLREKIYVAVSGAWLLDPFRPSPTWSTTLSKLRRREAGEDDAYNRLADMSSGSRQEQAGLHSFLVMGCAAAVGGAGGTTIGGAAGVVCGLVPAVFTFGLSIPIFAAIGASVGLSCGTAGGCLAGAVGLKICRPTSASGDPESEFYFRACSS